MRLAHLTFTVRPEAQHEALGVLLEEVPAVRDMAGCVAFIPFIDPTVTGGIGVLHEWATEADFAAYLASEILPRPRPPEPAPPAPRRVPARCARDS